MQNLFGFKLLASQPQAVSAKLAIAEFSAATPC